MFLIGFFCIILSLINPSSNMNILPYILLPYNGQMGYIVAIAIPLELSRFNVFLSYNYEANWNLHTLITDLRGSPLFFPMVGVNSEFTGDPNHLYTAGRTLSSSPAASLLQSLNSRKEFYKTIVDKINTV